MRQKKKKKSRSVYFLLCPHKRVCVRLHQKEKIAVKCREGSNTVPPSSCFLQNSCVLTGRGWRIRGYLKKKKEDEHMISL